MPIIKLSLLLILWPSISMAIDFDTNQLGLAIKIADSKQLSFPFMRTARGVSGAGNTGDSSIRLEFARSLAISVLQTVKAKDLLYASGSPKIYELYKSCRQTMFVAALKARFQLVKNIPDGGQYHALARRLPDNIIEVSRDEIERLLKSGNFSAAFLTAMILHELGHDCKLNGEAVDDSYDGLLNKMGTSLLEASHNHALAFLRDVDFIEKVKADKKVRFVDLSEQAQLQLTKKYVDYIGNWAYLKHQNLFHFRPAPASKFYTKPETSLFAGWGDQEVTNLALPNDLKAIINNVLKSSFESANIAYFNGKKNKALPTILHCRYQKKPNRAECSLWIDWSPLGMKSLANLKQQIHFSLDVFGKIEFQKLNFVGKSLASQVVTDVTAF